MSGIHYIFRQFASGELRLLYVTDTLMGAKHIVEYLRKYKKCNPATIMIMEKVG
jgi:hypothetical protein